MPASWVNTSFYDGDDIDADGNLWGLDGSDDAAAISAAVNQAAANVNASFDAFESQGVTGSALREWLRSGMEGPANAAINLFRASPLSPGAKAARDVAYKIQYELQQRAELKSSAPVPAWLLTELRKLLLQFLKDAATARISFEIPLTSVVHGTAKATKYVIDEASKIPKAASDAFWGSIPLWLKITGGVIIVGIGFTIYKVVTSAAPYARGYVERQAGMRGLRGRRQRLLPGRRSR